MIERPSEGLLEGKIDEERSERRAYSVLTKSSSLRVVQKMAKVK